MRDTILYDAIVGREEYRKKTDIFEMLKTVKKLK